jgi:DNA-binding GntR family transcriptional regulator
MGLVNSGDSRHLYQQAADIIKDRIRSGQYAPGQEIPSMAKMGKEFGISELTMERAFYQLRDQGWLVIRQGYATRIATDLPSEGTRDRLLEQARDLADRATRLVQAIEAMPKPQVG